MSARTSTEDGLPCWRARRTAREEEGNGEYANRSRVPWPVGIFILDRQRYGEREAGHGGKEVGHTSSGPRAKTEPRFAARSFDKYVARNDSVCQPCEPETVHPDGRTRIDLGCYPSCARFSNWKGSHRTLRMSCELFSSLRQPALSTSQVVSQSLLIRTARKNFNFLRDVIGYIVFVCRIIKLI